MENKEKIKNTLYSALKRDIAVKIIRVDKEYCTISLYKLDSVYNDSYTLYFDNSYYYKDGYEITKEKENIGKKLLFLIKDYVQNGRNIKELEKIFETFNEMTNKVYDIKYSIKALQNIWNL